MLTVLLISGMTIAAPEGTNQIKGVSPLAQSNLIFFQDKGELERLYKRSGNQLIWSQAGKLTPQSFEAIESLQQAQLMGLKTEKYATAQLLYSWNEIKKPKSESNSSLVKFDMALSASLMQFISDLYLGQVDPLETGFNVVVSQKHIDLAETVYVFSRSNNMWEAIQRLEPHFKAYQRLKEALSKYRQLAKNGKSKPLLAEMTIHPGDKYSDLVALRTLLIAVGDLDPDIPETDTYEDDIVDAFKHFQRRHGLKADGLIGPKTFQQLNTPLTKRVEQIELAMERLRWLPEPEDGPHIVVNIPAFELYAFKVKNGIETLRLKMGVIVGSALNEHETPIFVAEMKYLVFRPYWNVPYSIAVKELLPKLKKDPYYLYNHNYEILQGHEIISSGYFDPGMAAEVRSGKLRIRQKAGNDNALGLIKFIFPNSNSVYLHDTPARGLFSQSRRDFSHGCIRVQDPVRLAEFVLGQQDQGWDRLAIISAMQGRDDHKVVLEKQIPVHIFYTTVIVRENGDIAFFDDIYGHDKHLEVLLRSASQNKFRS